MELAALWDAVSAQRSGRVWVSASAVLWVGAAVRSWVVAASVEVCAAKEPQCCRSSRSSPATAISAGCARWWCPSIPPCSAGECSGRTGSRNLGRVAPIAVLDVSGISEAARSANMFELTRIMLK